MKLARVNKLVQSFHAKNSHLFQIFTENDFMNMTLYTKVTRGVLGTQDLFFAHFNTFTSAFFFLTVIFF